MRDSDGAFDFVVAGGGLVGLATARALLGAGAGSVAVLEAEPRLAAHQSGRNSGVVHSGLYYRPGSAKARLCVAGREALYRLCAERGIPCQRCGKVVVATAESELAPLAELERRGRANGLGELRRLDPRELREVEPGARGVAALWVGEAGIVDYPAVARVLAEDVRARGGEVRTGARLTAVERTATGLRLHTGTGAVICGHLVGCAGLHSDRLARACGLEPEVRIVPFRGEYYQLAGERRGAVRGLIYPVPDARLPFLGVHLTRTVDGRVLVGPNAVPAFSRHGYRWSDVSLRDLAEVVGFRGFRRMARRFWAAGAAEIARSLSRSRFLTALEPMFPGLGSGDLLPAPAGVRAQAVDVDGNLVDDFRFAEEEGLTLVLNAPSPAATACLAIGREVATRALAGSR